MSTNSASLLDLPNEYLSIIFELALIAKPQTPDVLADENGGTSDDGSRSAYMAHHVSWQTFRLREYTEIAVARRHREWTLSLRLVCHRINVVMEPLVLNRLTIDMRNVLSGSLDTVEMFNSIASGTAEAISKYTENIFIGSIYDRTDTGDLGTDCEEDEAEIWKMQSPSELRLTMKAVGDRARRMDPRFGDDDSGDDDSIGEDEGEGWNDDFDDEEDDLDDDEDDDGEQEQGEARPLGRHIRVVWANPFAEPNSSANEEMTLQQSRMSESIQEISIVMRDALRRFSALKSFKWNMKAESFNTHVCATILGALSTLDTLSNVSIGIYPKVLILPDIPIFRYTQNLSLFIYSAWGFSRQEVKLPDIIATNAKILASFPSIEHLSVHHYDSKAHLPEDDPTIQNLFARCSPDHAPPIKALELKNVLFAANHHTAPFFASLEMLTIIFMAQLSTVASTGTLPVIDDRGTTSLRTLVADGSFSESVFKIIPRAGLRHMILLGNNSFGGEEFTRENFDLILPGHYDTLESLALRYSERDASRWVYDDAMAATLSRFTQLRHLAITIFVEGTDGIDSSLQKTSEFLRTLPPSLRTLSLSVRAKGAHAPIARKILEHVEALIVTSTAGSPLSTSGYPLFVCVEDWSSFYRLQRTNVDELKYVRMTWPEVQEFRVTLPGGERWGLFGPAMLLYL